MYIIKVLGDNTVFKKILLLIPLCLSPLLAEQVSYTDFSGGLRTNVESDVLQQNESPDCLNTTVSENGTSLQKRKGFAHYKSLSSSTTYGCQGLSNFTNQDINVDYIVVAHGDKVSKVNSDTNSDFITTRSTYTYDQYANDDSYIYGCNGYDENWRYDGTTVTSFSTYTVTGDLIYFENAISSGSLWAGTNDNKIVVIDTTTYEISNVITLDGEIGSIAYDYDNEYIYATIPTLDKIAKINKNTEILDSYINVGANPNGLSYFDNSIFVVNSEDDNVVEISSSGITLNTYEVNDYPIYVLHNSTYSYVANKDSNNISKIILSTTSLNMQEQSELIVAGMAHIENFVYDSSNTYMWASDIAYNNIFKIDIDNMVVISTITMTDPVTDIIYNSTSIYSAVRGLGSSQINEIDIFSDVILSTITGAGFYPYSISIDSNSYMWAANYTQNSISKINLSSKVILSSITGGVAFDPTELYFDGTYLWAINGYVSADDEIYKIDTNSSVIIATFSVSQSNYVINDIDDDYLWVGGFAYIYKISKANGSIVYSKAMNGQSAALYTDENYLYYSETISPDEQYVSIFNMLTEELIYTYENIENGYLNGRNALFVKDSNLYYGANIKVYNLLINDYIVNTIDVGNSPISLQQDDDYLYCLNQSSETISKIDLSTDLIVSSITVGSSPQSLAIQSTTYLYCSNFGDDNISKIDLSDFSLETNISVEDPLQLLFSYGYLWCIRGDNNIVKINIDTYEIEEVIDNTGFDVYNFPKTFTHAFFKNRYWVANSTSYPTRVWHSVEGQLLNFDTLYSLDELYLNADIFDVGAYGDNIYKLVTYGGNLLVFKEKSIFVIVGDETPFAVFQIAYDLGCTNPESISEDSGYLYFYGNDNYYYRYDGQIFQRISNKIENEFKNITKDNKVCSTWFKNNMWNSTDYSKDVYYTITAQNKYIDYKTFVPPITFMTYVAEVTTGTYLLGSAETDAGTLCEAIRDAINAQTDYSTNLHVYIDNGKLNIRIDGVAPTFGINFLFSSGDNADNSIGIIIGFSADTGYIGSTHLFTADNSIYSSYNLSFLYSLMNESWWRVGGVNPYAYTIFDNELYLADIDYGVLLKQDYDTPLYYDYKIVDSTNVSINSYYYTRNDYLSDGVLKKYLDYFYLAMDSKDSGSLFWNYYIHGVEAQNLVYTMISSDPSIINVNRYPRGEQGYYYQWKFYNDQYNVNFDIYNFTTEYRYRPLEVSK